MSFLTRGKLRSAVKSNTADYETTTRLGEKREEEVIENIDAEELGKRHYRQTRSKKVDQAMRKLEARVGSRKHTRN